jgi:hypothetical protein
MLAVKIKSHIVSCRQCHEQKCRVTDDFIICLDCGYEETAELYFAEKMSDAIMDELSDGFSRSSYLVELAEAWKSL